MMNKYIDHLTVEEYRTIQRELKARLDTLKKEMEETGNTKKYVEIRFIILKITNLIKKYEKKI